LLRLQRCAFEVVKHSAIPVSRCRRSRGALN
jgi:hypothetical protein